MSYSKKQTKIGVLREILEKFQTPKAQYGIFTNCAKSPYTVLIKIGHDFRDLVELQRWESNWQALEKMTHPSWAPEHPVENSKYLFPGMKIGAPPKGLAQEDLGHFLALQDRGYLWGLKDYTFEIEKMREIIKQMSHRLV